MSEKSKINITIYDPRIKKAPFKSIILKSFEGIVPKNINGEVYRYLFTKAHEKGYSPKFWSIDTINEKIEYNIYVHNAGSPGSDNYHIQHWPNSEYKEETLKTENKVYDYRDGLNPLYKACLIKSFFMTCLDGGYEKEPLFPGIDSYKIGLCKLEIKDNALQVYCRRPGILIGKQGIVINTIMKELDYNINIHTVNILV